MKRVSKKTQIGFKLLCIERKCNLMLSMLNELQSSYVHRDMDSLLMAARDCAARDVVLYGKRKSLDDGKED